MACIFQLHEAGHALTIWSSLRFYLYLCLYLSTTYIFSFQQKKQDQRFALISRNTSCMSCLQTLRSFFVDMSGLMKLIIHLSVFLSLPPFLLGILPGNLFVCKLERNLYKLTHCWIKKSSFFMSTPHGNNSSSNFFLFFFLKK